MRHHQPACEKLEPVVEHAFAQHSVFVGSPSLVLAKLTLRPPKLLGHFSEGGIEGQINVLVPALGTLHREPYLTLFYDELRSGGWVEERNLALEYRSVSGRAELLPEVALALASTQPDAAVALRGAASTRAAQRATIAFLDTPSVG